ncbi:SPOSA6832_00917, partial [Sporobolomyces salmonicolor]
MPLPVAIHALSSPDALLSLAKWGGLPAAVLVVRSWAKGYVCREDRNLAGKTFILTGCFSGTGLSVLQSLADRGAQIIALHPSPTSASVVQLLMLVRSVSSNERIYVEECDLSSISSIKTFVQSWQRDAKSGMVQDIEARVDGIVFCEGDGAGEEGMGYGVGVRYARQVADVDKLERRHATHLTGRHALVQLLLPTLLRSASTSTSPVRIVNQVSPFYAAVTPSTFHPLDLDYTSSERPYPSKAPWLAEGQVALASILLWREFQSRIRLASSSQPSSTSPPSAAAAPTSSPILALSLCPGLTRSSIRQTLRVSPSHSCFSFAGLALYLLIWPLVWLFAKSAGEAAEGIMGALMGDTEGEKQRGRGKKVKGPDGKEEDVEKEADDGKDGIRRMTVKGGAFYREGLEVRITMLEALDPSVATQLWDAESKRVERLLSIAVKLEKETKGEADTRKSSGGAETAKAGGKKDD